MTILQPVVVLAAWTMVMWAWMYATRVPAMQKARINPQTLADTPGASLDTLLPVQVQWKAKNYNHLHEAPTVFYAVALALALLEAGQGLALLLAWVYVGIRIVHSLLQATVNQIVPRFLLFNLSQVVLLALIVLAALAAF